MLRGGALALSLSISPASSARVAHHARQPGPARASVRGQADPGSAPQPRWNLRAPPELTRRTFTLPNDAWTVVDPRATWPLLRTESWNAVRRVNSLSTGGGAGRLKSSYALGAHSCRCLPSPGAI